jgi:hypothetical protein
MSTSSGSSGQTNTDANDVCRRAAWSNGEIRTSEHLGPVLRLGAAGAGMDGDDRVRLIVLPGEHLLALRGVDLLLELLEAPLQIAADVFSGFGPLEEDAQVVAAPLECLQQRQLIVDAPAALHHLLRFRLVAPEVRRADVLFDIR